MAWSMAAGADQSGPITATLTDSSTSPVNTVSIAVQMKTPGSAVLRAYLHRKNFLGADLVQELFHTADYAEWTGMVQQKETGHALAVEFVPVAAHEVHAGQDPLVYTYRVLYEPITMPE